MTDTQGFKRLLHDSRKHYVEAVKAIKPYIGKEIQIQSSGLDLPKHISTYKIYSIDVSENVVCLSWLDEEEDDWILEDVTIKQFIEHAEFI